MEDKDWVYKAAVEVSRAIIRDPDLSGARVEAFIRARVPEPPLLQCSDCHNTESCAGAMARQFNHGRCLHCGGYFKVVRA